MKDIRIVIPTYNEVGNITYAYERVCKALSGMGKDFCFKILFIDNHSDDGTEDEIRRIASGDDRVFYIFNTQNFGYARSSFYGLTQAGGDAVVLLSADMQEPPELIPEMLELWKRGEKMVVGIKKQSRESKTMYWIRTRYYRYIGKNSNIHHIEHFNGYGIYDKSIIDIFKGIHDPMPYLRGMVAELAPDPAIVYYEQEERKYGKTHWSINQLIDMAMLGITSYSKSLLRFFTCTGVAIAIISVIFAVVNFALKMFNIVEYPLGIATLICGLFLLGGCQMLFLGIVGEYVFCINTRLLNRPHVVEKERNF